MTRTQRTLYFVGVCAMTAAIGLLLLLFSARTAHAAVLLDYSTIDGNINIGNQVTSGFRYYSWFNDYSGSGSLFPGTGSGVSTGGDVRFVRFYRDPSSADSCAQMHVDIYKGDGNPMSGTMGTPAAVPGTNECEAAITGASNAGQLFWLTFICSNTTGCNSNTADIVGTYTGNPGYIVSGTQAPPFLPGGFALQLCDAGGCPGGGFNPPTPPSTFIHIDQPTQGTTTMSNTLPIDISYGIGTDLSQFSLDGSLPSKIGINLTLINNGGQGGGSNINLGTDFNISTSTGSFTYSTTTTQDTGDYTLLAQLIGVYGTFIPAPPDCTPLPPFQTCTGTTESDAVIASSNNVTFSLNNGLFPILGFQVGSTTSRNGLATTTCSITAIGGCFQNALAFLFFPSPDILNQFQFLWSIIQNKPPFGYVSQTIVGLRSINASSTPAFSFGDIPLQSTIFTPFRTGLGALLWIGFFIAWYRGRLRHLDI